MSVTRAQLEVVLIARVGASMIAAGLDGTTVTGSNTALSDPLAYAVRTLDVVPASLLTVADADLATIDSSNIDQLLDVAEWRTLVSCVRNFTEYSQRVDLDDKRLDDVRKGLQDAEAKALKNIQQSYGVGAAVAQFGVLELGFAETDPTQTDPVTSFP